MGARSFVSRNIGARPVRIDLAIAPGSFADFRRAVELTTTCWAGSRTRSSSFRTKQMPSSKAELPDVDVIAPVGSTDAIMSAAQARASTNDTDGEG